MLRKIAIILMLLLLALFFYQSAIITTEQHRLNLTSGVESRAITQPNYSLSSVPSQEWLRRRYQAVVGLLGLSYSPPNKWNNCRNTFNTLLFPKLNVLFTGIPKAGCSNWMEALMIAEGVIPRPLKVVNDVHSVYAGPYRLGRVRKSGAPITPSFSFTGIRNPWTRIVSAYKDKLQPGTNLYSAVRKVLRFSGRELAASPGSTDTINYPTFEEFLRYLIGTKGSANYHFRPQVHTLCMGVAEYDFIAPIEYSAAMAPMIWRELDIAAKLPMSYDKSSDPRTQRSTMEARNMFVDIDSVIIEELYRIYRPDFMLANYSNFTDPNFPMPLL